MRVKNRGQDKNPKEVLMKILTLTLEYPPQIFGGLGTYVTGLSQEISRTGDASDIFLYRSDVYLDAEFDPNPMSGIRVEAVRLPAYSGLYWVDQIAANTAILDALMRRLRSPYPPVYDVVHCHSWILYQAGKTFADHLGIPIVGHYHRLEIPQNPPTTAAPGFAEPNVARLQYALSMDRYMGQSADAIIAVGQELLRKLQHLEANLAPSHAIPCALGDKDLPTLAPDEYWEQRQDSLRRAQRPLRLLFAGRLVSVKGLDIALAARQRLGDCPIELAVAGDGPESSVLDSYRDCPWLTILGHLDRKEIDQAYAWADFVVVPSLQEPFGYVVIEALARGIPVLGSDTGGIQEILSPDERLGLLLPPGDISAWTSAFQTVLRTAPQWLTPERAQLRRTHVEINYAWPKVYQQIREVYLQVLEGHNHEINAEQQN